jgi:hypothetical protein
MADPTAPQTTPLFGVPIAAAGAPQAAPVAAPAAPQVYREQDGKHRGVAGVARDILGTLGDFLLTRLHMPAMYAPAQKSRKLAAAEANIDTDPIGAIQQVSSLDPVFGAKLRDQYIDNQRLAATQASTTEARNARLAQAQEGVNLRTRGYAASMLGSMATWDDAKRQQFYPQMRDQVINAGKRQGLDLSGELPEKFDPTALDAFIDGAVPVGTQRAQRLTKERIDNQDEQAGARVAATERGQDLSHADRQSGQAITARGQDIRASTAAAGRSAASDRLDRRLAARPAPAPRAAKPTAADLTYLRQNPGARDKFDGRFGVGMSKRVLGN